MIADKLTSFFVIVNFGSLILLSFLSLANPLKANQIANRLMGVFFLLWASFWADEILFLVYNIELNQKWQLFFRGLQFFAPILFYFIVVFYSNPGFNIKKNLLLHIFFPVGYLILLYYYGQSPSEKINYVFIGLMLSQSLLYITASFFKIRKHQKVVLFYSSQTSEIDLSWLEKIVKGLLLIVIAIILYNIIYSLKPLNLTMNVINLIGIFYIAFHALKQKEIYPFKETAIEEIISLSKEPAIGESKKKIVTDEELAILKSQLTQFMLIQKPYLDSELNLVKLADLFGTSTHKLSYIINTGFNVNFFNFINKHRVEEAKSLLLSTKLDQYSILGIAYQAGFNSKTTFNTTFKKFVNQTPSDYINSSSTL